MDTITLKPERKAQLEDYARRRGQDIVEALKRWRTTMTPG
jgi:hypothetical protein